ncbi:MAG: hypothetical protein QM831_23830 [Kofleriaceae bacterium]
MRRQVVMFAMLAAGCSDGAVDMTLLLPTGGSDFDMSCVSAVDLLPIANGDDGSLDLGTRTDASCATVTSVKSFTALQPALAGKFSVDLPKAGLAGVVLRGRAGDCNGSEKQESVFYGGGAYTKGNDTLQIKVNRGIGCDVSQTFTVHPTDMYGLFGSGNGSGSCGSGWTDTTATVVSAEIRETNFATTPIITEIGATSTMAGSGTTSVASHSQSYPGSCAAVKLHSDTLGMTGIGCINANVTTACAGADVELAVLSDAMLASADNVMDGSKTYVEEHGAPNFIGVWTMTPTPAVLETAKIELDADSGDAAVVYGHFSDANTFMKDGSVVTNLGGVAIVFTNHVVGITISHDGKSSRHMYIGSSLGGRGSYIAVLD